MRNTLYSLACILFAHTAYAQHGFKGTVIDSESNPVIGAIVTITDNETSNTLYSTSTDSIGNYEAKNCPENFKLNITAFGYEAYSSTKSMTEASNEKVITRLAHITLAEVVIEANAQPRMKRDGNKMVIDNIENSPYAKSSNTYTFLRYVPILKVPVFEGDITVMGGGAATLHINGRKSNMPIEAALKNIPAESIEKIEIIARPGSEYSTSSNTSIINIVMKKKTDEGFKYSLYLADAQSGTNRQNGSFSLSYSANKLYITSGLYINNQRYKGEYKEEYRHYDDDLYSSLKRIEKTKRPSLFAYLNLDYELNKKNTLGIRVSADGNKNNNTNRTETNYGKLSTGEIDSTYLSKYKNGSPARVIRINTNLNYSFKTDDKGSMFLADLDYVTNTPKDKVNNIFDKKTPTTIVREQDFIQHEQTDTDAFGVWARYNHVFEKGRLNSGISLSGTKTMYKHTFSYFLGNDYQIDPNRNNYLDFDDFTTAVYTSYQRTWSKKFTTDIGLRMEYYNAKGKQKSTDEDISRDDIELIPSLYINYAPSDNHDLALDFSRFVGRPRYSELNPFKTYTSPTTYIKGNPNLKNTSSLSANLSYTFFKDYRLNIFAMSVQKGSTEFTIPDENNQIMITKVSYGKSSCIVPEFKVTKRIFKGYLYLSGNMYCSYSKRKGKAENIDINIEDWDYGYYVSSDIVLSKKAGLSIYTGYAYYGRSHSIASSSPSHQNIDTQLTKKFSNSSLALGMSKGLYSNYKRYYETPGYGYTILRKSYWGWQASYSITFGNKKVRNVQDRRNNNVSGRI